MKYIKFIIIAMLITNLSAHGAAAAAAAAARPEPVRPIFSPRDPRDVAESMRNAGLGVIGREHAYDERFLGPLLPYDEFDSLWDLLQNYSNDSDYQKYIVSLIPFMKFRDPFKDLDAGRWIVKKYSTPLEYATYILDPELVTLLLRLGANPAQVGSIEWPLTGLHEAINSPYLQRERGTNIIPIIHALLSKDHNLVNIKNYDGDTPLMVATRKQLLNIVAALLTHNTDISIRDKNGEDILSIANNELENYRKKLAEHPDNEFWLAKVKNAGEIVRLLTEYSERKAKIAKGLSDAELFKKGTAPETADPEVYRLITDYAQK